MRSLLFVSLIAFLFAPRVVPAAQDPSTGAPGTGKPARPAKAVTPPPLQTGNRVFNGSFELGAAGWIAGRIEGAAGDGVHGKHRGRVPAGEGLVVSRPFPVRPGQPYAVSASLRSAAPGAQVEVALVELGGAERAVESFDLTPEWSRASIKVELPRETGSRCYLRLRSAGGAPGFEVDAVQVEEGEATAFQPGGAVEAAIALAPPQLFPEPDRVLEVPVRTWSEAAPEKAEIRYRIESFNGDNMGFGAEPVPGGSGPGEVRFRFRPPLLGTQRLVVEAWSGDHRLSRDEAVLTALPPADPQAPPGPFLGAAGSVPKPLLSASARAGIRWLLADPDAEGRPAPADLKPLKMELLERPAKLPQGWRVLDDLSSPGLYSWLGKEQEAREAALEAARRVVLARVSGAGRLFVPVGRSAAPGVPFGGEADRDFLEYDGSLKPAFATAAAANRLLDGAAPAAASKRGDLVAHAFRRRGETVLAIWSPAAATGPPPVRFPVKPLTVRAFGVMGNPRALPGDLESVLVRPRPEPTYVVFTGLSAEAAIAAVDAAK